MNAAQIAERFDGLTRRCFLLQERYNPEGKNLHFGGLADVDGELFQGLLELAREGADAWGKLAGHGPEKRQDRARVTGTVHGFYYDLFLTTSCAAVGAESGGLQGSISPKAVLELFRTVLDLDIVTRVWSGDLLKRHGEALGNMLWAFDRPVLWREADLHVQRDEPAARHIGRYVDKARRSLAESQRSSGH